MIRTIEVVVLILMLMSSSYAQAPASASPDNPALAAQVQRSLRSTHIAGAEDIKVEAKGDNVQLSGFVESDHDQEKALETARAVRGVASVRNDLVVRESRPTVGQALDDTIIAAQVRQQIQSKVANAAGDINVSVSDGVVQLSGYVADATAKNRAADVASAVQGVQDVRNDIALKQ